MTVLSAFVVLLDDVNQLVVSHQQALGYWLIRVMFQTVQICKGKNSSELFFSTPLQQYKCDKLGPACWHFDLFHKCLVKYLCRVCQLF